jgi:uncharacterized protein (TIGR02757 family)
MRLKLQIRLSKYLRRKIKTNLKDLDSLYQKYKSIYSSDDPVRFLHKFKNKNDIEIIGLVASSYAYGQIGIINKFITEFLLRIDNKPYEFVNSFDIKKYGKIFEGMNYRFNNHNDLINLLQNVKMNLELYGSLLGLFKEKYSDEDENILKALTFFSDSLRKKYVNNLMGYDYLIPDVKKNSTCKRLNLFLRWMVRKDDIDLGVWGSVVDKSKLIIPVDTHVYSMAKKYKLVKRKSCDMKFAIELTEKLKKYDANDPVKYDFALCHDDI